MPRKNIYWIIAGGINLFTSIVHLVGGQMTLVNPLMESDLITQVKAEWWGVWHMVTVLLFASSFSILKSGFKSGEANQVLVKTIGIFYILISIPSVISSAMMKVLAPQWILLLPIGLLCIWGLKKEK